MNKEEFLKELTKEGLLIYGTTWLENFKRLKELKKYKEMWGELETTIRPGRVIEISEECLSTQGGVMRYLMKKIEQKYSQKKYKKTVSFEIELEHPNSDYLGSEIDTTIALRRYLNSILPKGVSLLLGDKITIKPFKDE